MGRWGDGEIGRWGDREIFIKFVGSVRCGQDFEELPISFYPHRNPPSSNFAPDY
ncbi:MAG: hypothetical protein F6K26_29195 [Moorea sp. SIO2I5]|nr:hypothetical protein [Moorena sp. SIO2I5]